MSARTKQGGRVDERLRSDSAEDVAQWLYANGHHDAAATVRNQIDVRNMRIRELQAAIAQNAQGEAAADQQIRNLVYKLRDAPTFPEYAIQAADVIEKLHAERAMVPQEWRSLLANLAAVVRVQNGNRHDDTNRLLDHADRLLAVTPQPDTTKATP